MTITRRAALAAACVLPGLSPAMAQPARWQAATGFAEGNYLTRNLRTFIEEVAASTNGAVQIQLHANGSLMPQPPVVVVNAIRAAGQTMVEEWATRAGEDGRRMLDQYHAAQG